MSTIGEKLTASKNGLMSLLDYANRTTGNADTDIGEAIRTLCDGYGQGGESNPHVIIKTFKFEVATMSYCFDVDSLPIIVYVWSQTGVGTIGNWNVWVHCLLRAITDSTLSNFIGRRGNGNATNSTYTYENGVFTITCDSDCPYQANIEYLLVCIY